jgi:hypothetical protein
VSCLPFLSPEVGFMSVEPVASAAGNWAENDKLANSSHTLCIDPGRIPHSQRGIKDQKREKVKTMRRFIAGCWGLILGVFLTLPDAAHSAPLPVASAPITISGRVTTRAGTPVAGTVIEAHSTDFVSPTPDAIATTGADGRYTLTIPTALYGSLFSGSLPVAWHFDVMLRAPDGKYAEPSEETVTARVGQSLTGSDFLLTDGPQITVHVQDAITGAPVPGMAVEEQNYNGPPADRPTPVVTNAQGIAVITYNPILVNFVNLELTAPGGTQPTVGPAPGYEFYYQKTLNPPQDAKWDVKTYSLIPPEPPMLWQGTVLAPDGKSAVGATVDILRGDSHTVATTDKAGHFGVMMPPMNRDEYNGDYRPDAIYARQGDSVGILVPTPDQTWDGMTVPLVAHSAAEFTGTVVSASGHPEAGVGVTATGFVGESSGSRHWTADNGGVSGKDGRFQISGLPDGRYEIDLGGPGYGPVVLPPTVKTQGLYKANLPLQAGQHEDVGMVVVPVADETISGQVVSDTGAGVGGALCIIKGAHTNQLATTDTNGNFTAYHVVDEPLTCTVQLNFPLGPNVSTDKQVLAVPIQSGSQDARIVIPTAELPPPAPVLPPVRPRPIPPAPKPLTGPPHEIAMNNMMVLGYAIAAYHDNGIASDFRPSAFDVTWPWMQFSADKPWHGSMAQLNGATLAAKDGRDTLSNAQGEVLWSGDVNPPPPYTVTFTNTVPPQATIQDGHGHTLWSGTVMSVEKGVVQADQQIIAVNPKGRIVWQHPDPLSGIEFLHPGSSHHKQPMPQGTVHIHLVPCRAVYQLQDGKSFSADGLFALTFDLDVPHHSPADFALAGQTIFPFTLKTDQKILSLTLYDAQGNVILSPHSWTRIYTKK